MEHKKFSFRIASDASKEKAFVELFYDNDQVAEISQEKKDPIITFFSPSTAEYWEFSCDEAIKALETARNQLFAM